MLLEPEHSIDLDKTRILAVEPRWFERGAKEAIHIRLNNPTLNRDGAVITYRQYGTTC